MKDYIKNKIFPEYVKTNYKRKLYENKWKGFIIKDNKLYFEPEKLIVIPSDEIESILKQEYQSSNSAGLGYKQFYYLIAGKYLNIKRAAVQEFLNRQPTYQMTRQSSHFINKPILSKHCNERWSIDLIDFNRYGENNGYRYILSCIDYFSRYCWIRALKNKTSEEVKDQMKNIISEARTKPKVLQSDNGGEFRGKLTKYCDDVGIKQVFTLSYTPQSNGLVENLNNQIRKILREMFLRNNNTIWYDKLELVAKNKNNQKNSTIKNPPIAVWHPGYNVFEDNTSEAFIKERASKLMQKYKAVKYEIGDLVRVKMSALFSHVRQLIKDGDKKYLSAKYTPEIYKIRSILMPDNEGFENERYTLSTLDGELLQTQLKKNNINAVRKAKRFFASDFLRATDDSETTNLTSKDVLKLSKLSAEPQKRKRKIQKKRIRTIVQMETIPQRPQRAIRLDYAELNDTGRRIPLNPLPIPQEAAPIPQVQEIQPQPQPVQEPQPIQRTQRRPRVDYAQLNRTGRSS